MAKSVRSSFAKVWRVRVVFLLGELTPPKRSMEKPKRWKVYSRCTLGRSRPGDTGQHCRSHPLAYIVGEGSLGSAKAVDKMPGSVREISTGGLAARESSEKDGGML